MRIEQAKQRERTRLRPRHKTRLCSHL